ncbi:MAG: enoyl-ACP reductase [Gemmatimonadales bacterium]
MITLEDKTVVVTGVANQWSIAWAVAQACRAAGATVVLPYLSERELKGIRKLVGSSGGYVTPPAACDASNDEHLDSLFAYLRDEFTEIHALAHSIAFAPPEALRGAYADTTRDDFKVALEVSAYSLIALTRRAAELMTVGGSVVTMSFMASQRAFRSYNVMGTAKAALEQAVRQLAFEMGPRNIRVNTISPGPINTVSARGVKGFSDFLKIYEERAPLRRAVTQQEVGNVALFLFSDLASGVTGEVVHVDAGYNIVGM